MKKSILTIFLAAASIFGAAAQNTDGAPNRMLVIDQNGAYNAYNITHVDNISFATVAGKVAAEVQINKFSNTSLELTVQRTEQCKGFIINVIPGVIARQLEKNPASAGSYLETLKSPTYFEDFSKGTLSGLELKDATEYAVATVGIDNYNTYCDLSTAYFTTSSKPLVGSPAVDAKVTSTSLYSISVDFTPNKDVSGYSYVIGEKGTMQAQFETFASMFGFENFGEMIKMWGVEEQGNSSHTFSDLSPNTEYEIFIQAWDKNETFAPLKIIEASTDSKGGAGEAYVTITPGAYKLADWDGETLPSQFFSFTPNDQTSAYRFSVQFAVEYNKDPEAYKAELCKDPDQPMAYYWFYEPISTDFQINPNVDVVVIAAGKNANNQWGAVNELKYTTPDKAGIIAKTTGVMPRIIPTKPDFQRGKLPVLNCTSGAIRLSK